MPHIEMCIIMCINGGGNKMPSNLNFDENLLSEAQKIGGFKYKKDAVNAALQEYVDRHKQMEIISLFGKIPYIPKHDHKAGRKNR